MDSCSYELSKAKWGAMEPSDIATLSLQFCIDSLLTLAVEDCEPEVKGKVVLRVGVVKGRLCLMLHGDYEKRLQKPWVSQSKDHLVSFQTSSGHW